MSNLGASPGPGNHLVTRGDLREVQLDLQRLIEVGFAGVHERQDKLNGRTGRNEVTLGAQGARLDNLEQEVLARRRNDRKSRPESLMNTTLTMRDAKVFGAGGSAVTAAILFLWKVLPALIKALS